MRCGRRDTRRWRGRRLHRVDRRHRWRRSCDRRCGRLCVHGRCRCVHGRCRRMHCGRRRATDMGRRRRSGTCAIMHLVHLGARMRVGDRRTTGRAIAVRRGYAGEHMIARSRRRVTCADLCVRGTWLRTGERMIARSCRRVTGADFCARGAWLDTRQRVIARNGPHTGSQFPHLPVRLDLRRDGLAVRWRQPACRDARQRLRPRSIGPGARSPRWSDGRDCC